MIRVIVNKQGGTLKAGNDDGEERLRKAFAAA